MQNNIAAIILAAGEGKRIGQPKWQIQYKGKTFLEIIIEKLKSNSLSQIICVIRSNSIPTTIGITYSINQTPDNGTLSSVFYGIKSTSKASGFLIFPVDHPFVKEETIELLLEAFIKSPEKVIRPAYKETPGHPIIIPKCLASKILNSAYEGGLKKFIRDNNPKLINIAVDDPYVLNNINTLESINQLK